MGYNTALTEWPSVSVPESVKSHLDKFFSIMDTNAPGQGDRLADEIFASDGSIDGHHQVKGTAALRKCRDAAWKVIDSRRHEILKVYTDSDMGNDLLAIGQVTVGYKSGERKRGEFIARIELSDSQTVSPTIQRYKVWMDTAAMVILDQSEK